jgi:hypothetical protein
MKGYIRDIKLIKKRVFYKLELFLHIFVRTNPAVLQPGQPMAGSKQATFSDSQKVV